MAKFTKEQLKEAGIDVEVARAEWVQQQQDLQDRLPPDTSPEVRATCHVPNEKLLRIVREAVSPVAKEEICSWATSSVFELIKDSKPKAKVAPKVDESAK